MVASSVTVLRRGAAAPPRAYNRVLRPRQSPSAADPPAPLAPLPRPTRDGTSVNWPLGLTFPEFVLDNAQIRVLQGVRVPMGRYI